MWRVGWGFECGESLCSEGLRCPANNLLSLRDFTVNRLFQLTVIS